MNAGLILARTDSSRLPNKALRDLGGKKLIQWSIDGINALENVTPIIVTSNRPVDDPLIEVAQENKIDYFRGSFENIAKRVLDCIQHFEIENFARCNGDGPFFNLGLLEEGFAKITGPEKYDFVTNIVPREFPYAMNVEIFRSQFYIEHYPSLIPEFQEAFSSWFYKHIDRFNAYQIRYPYGNDHHLIRLAVDTAEDLKRLNDFIQKNPTLDIQKAPLNIIINLLKQHIKSYS